LFGLSVAGFAGFIACEAFLQLLVEIELVLAELDAVAVA
jgi:hypothetical protein